MPSSGLLTLYHPALDAGSSPAWIPVFTGMTHSLSSSAWLGIQLVWIYVFTGMTEGGCGIQPCLDSRFHGNDTPLVILNRKRSASDWGSSPSRHPALDAGSSPAWIPVFTGMTHSLSSSTESKALRIGDPVLSGFPFSREWRTGIGDPETICLDSRFHGNDRRGAGMTKGRYGNDKRNENDNR